MEALRDTLLITAINSEVEYKAALAEIEKYIDQGARASTTQGDCLNLLTLLVQDYERKRVESQPPDPVEAIKFRMEQMNLTPRDLVPLIGSRSKVSEVLSRKRPLTLSMVRALHKGLGIPAKSLLQEQTLLNVGGDAIQWEHFPIREMIARGWINERVTDVRRQAREVMQRFLAPLPKDWIPVALYKQTHYLRSARQMDLYALAAWNARVCMRALGAPLSVKFEPGVLSLDFMRELAHLSTLSDGPRHAREYLEKVGISVVVEGHLPETYLDGAAILAAPDRPIIALTIRHNRLDNFWFVLMHELVHVWRHLGEDLSAYYDDLDVEDSKNPQEREADQMAGEALIPEAEWKKSPASSLRTPDAVSHLASRLRIHPAIVAGRIRHHYRSYRVLNRLVGQGEVRRLFPEAVWSSSR
jgi:HTH-type transcriptional regulator / antitoxin HigA